MIQGYYSSDIKQAHDNYFWVLSSPIRISYYHVPIYSIDEDDIMDVF